MDLVTWSLKGILSKEEMSKKKKKKKGVGWGWGEGSNWKEEKFNSSTKQYLPNSYLPATLSRGGHSKTFTTRP